MGAKVAHMSTQTKNKETRAGITLPISCFSMRWNSSRATVLIDVIPLSAGVVTEVGDPDAFGPCISLELSPLFACEMARQLAACLGERKRRSRWFRMFRWVEAEIYVQIDDEEAVHYQVARGQEWITYPASPRDIGPISAIMRTVALAVWTDLTERQWVEKVSYYEDASIAQLECES